MEGLGQNPQGQNPDLKQFIANMKIPERRINANGGDQIVDSMQSALEAVRLNPRSTATIIPIQEWDQVELNPTETEGIYEINVAGFRDPVGITGDKEGFLSRFSKAS